MAMNPRLLRPLATGFNPKSIPGLLMWSDASDQSRAFSDDAATTLAANDVGVAVLKSKVGPDLAQTILANRPTYKTGLRAGKAGLRFDGINDSMPFSSTITQALGQHIFAAVDTTSLQNSLNLVFLERSSASGFNLALYLSASTGSARQPSVYYGAHRATWGAAVTAPAVIRWHYATSLTEVQVNNQTTVSGVTGVAALTNWNSVANSSVQQAAFDLFELLIYSSLTATQVAAVNNYLMKRWSI
jgi:hypothetical protein